MQSDQRKICKTSGYRKDPEDFRKSQDPCDNCGFGEQVEDFVMREGIPLKVRTIGISDDYVEHGNVDVLRKEVGLDRESIVKKVIADDRRIKEEK